MKHYTYNEYDPTSSKADASGGYRVTVSEDWIRQQYWPYWQQKMQEKYKDDPDLITWDNCLHDWIITNWAWETNE